MSNDLPSKRKREEEEEEGRRRQWELALSLLGHGEQWRLNVYALRHADPALKRDKEFMVAAISRNGRALERPLASTKMRRRSRRRRRCCRRQMQTSSVLNKDYESWSWSVPSGLLLGIHDPLGQDSVNSVTCEH